MNSLVLISLASMVAVSSASLQAGAILKGPSGIVTPLGPIGPTGPAGTGLALGGLGLGLGGLGLGLGGGLGLGLGGVALATPVSAAITNGGGTITATGLGATVAGPPTAPAVIAGPSGKIVADGLWGPTPLLVGKAW